MRVRPAIFGFMILTLVGSAALLAQDVPEPLLNEQTLRRDIETAGFYELIDWLEGLDQSTSGDRDALARRLFDYYGVVEEAMAEEQSTPLVVDSATRTRYFTLDEIDERYVRLSGGVTITLRDDERDVTHQIVADEVTYNQDLNVLSASGDVIYTLDRGGTVEQFSGAALTVQLDDWDGAFVQGVTERARTIDGQQVDFSFAGRYITRSSNDVVVMEEGRVTSSVADPPNYEIRADKIWVLAPGEWGLRNAYLYVGRVAVFYFPFFFRPGNELFFNPSVGVRDREGRFVQTTTYLLGEPEESEAAFSFLQIAEEEGAAGTQRIEGLYLVPDEAADLAPQDSGAVLRVLTDIYTKLGAYAGVDGRFPGAGPLKNLDVYLGLGMSRHIYSYSYPGQGTTYSPYYLVDGETFTSWNGAQIGSVRIPFRFGLGLSAALGGRGYTLAGDATMFSDSRFQRDFDRRTEQIDWLGLVGQGSPVPEPGLVTSYEWVLRGTLTPPMTSLSPWVQRLALQNAAIALRWREKSVESPPAVVAAADSSPEAGFFYPDNLQLPNVSGVISGQLLRLSSSSAIEPNTADPPESDLRPPWVEQLFVPLAAEDLLRLPVMQGELAPPRVPELWNASLGYTFTPTGLVENTFDSDEWNNPEDVDFSLAYSAASGRIGGTVPMALNLLSNRIGLTGSLAASGQYRTVFNQSETLGDTAWKPLLTQAYSYSSANVTGNLALRVSPFAGSRYWSRSTVSYSINLLLYQLKYQEPPPVPPEELPPPPEYDQIWIDWSSEDYIRSHQVQLSVALDVLSGQGLRLTADVWPRTPRYTGQLDLGLSPLSVSIASGIVQEEQEDEKTWIWQPITSAQALVLGDLGQIQNQISYDSLKDEVAYNRTTASLGPVRANLEMRTTEGFNFEPPGEDSDFEQSGEDIDGDGVFGEGIVGDGITGEGWIANGANSERRFRASRAEISANLTSELEPLWRNRLRLAGSLTSAWSINLLRYTDSSFTFGLNADVEVTDFLTLSISSQSTNTQSYVYVGPLAEGVGRQRRSLVVDLLKSFNFFKRQDRVESAFNLQQIQLNATHYLEDWDLTVSYSGRPVVVTIDNRREYDWQSSLSIELQWRAIRELSSNVRADDQSTGDADPEGSGWDLTFGSDS